MVFGFFFASVAIIAVGTILNALFGAALVNVQFNSLTGIFSLASFLLIYARICTTTVAAIFALQAYLPDHVINFLGGRDGANTLGSMANSVKEIFTMRCAFHQMLGIGCDPTFRVPGRQPANARPMLCNINMRTQSLDRLARTISHRFPGKLLQKKLWRASALRLLLMSLRICA